PAGGGRQRGDAARDNQGPGRLGPRLAAVTAVAGSRRPRRPVRVRSQRHLGGNTHSPILATIPAQTGEARRATVTANSAGASPHRAPREGPPGPSGRAILRRAPQRGAERTGG